MSSSSSPGLRVDRHVVEAEECEGNNQSRSLVPIDEGVVSDQVKEVCGRHLEESIVQVVAVVDRPRYRERGLQQIDIPDVAVSSVSVDLVGVERQHLIAVEEPDGYYPARRLNTPPQRSWASLTTPLNLAMRFLSRTGVITMTSPSVETSSGVSASRLSALSSGLSMTSAKLWPSCRRLHSSSSAFFAALCLTALFATFVPTAVFFREPFSFETFFR